MGRVIITGGGGFIGAYLTKKMVQLGWSVGVIDSMIRGDQSRLASVSDRIDLYEIDIRDELSVARAVKGADVVMHLAAINGTENFYKKPELVLDVGIRGALSVVNACRESNVPDLVVASTAEVYQTPEVVPTPETIPLMLPNSLNPRYSYGGSKIVSELITFNYAREYMRKVQVFRPHNIYGPDMGWKHVVPQFISNIAKLIETNSENSGLEIQGSGSETRAFCYVDDVVDGILTMYEKGGHREIYHIGNDRETTILDLAKNIGMQMGVDLVVKPSASAWGGTPRRCPDISKIRELGYEPKTQLNEGLAKTIEWYKSRLQKTLSNELL